MFGLNKKLGLKQNVRKVKEKQTTQKEEGQHPSKKFVVVPDLICKSYADGCLVLGCVRDIMRGELVVSLPGIGNFGYVKLNNVSSTYTDLLKKDTKQQTADESNKVSTLLEMYQKGNLVRCKVLNYMNQKLYLSIEPSQVNSSLTYKSLEDNMIISGAVKCKEDHGYTIDLGVENLTGFLRTTATLHLGHTGLFKVVDRKSSRSIALTLAGDADTSLFYALKSNRFQFDALLPGTQLSCIVDKASKHGLQVDLGQGSKLIAYVHPNHLNRQPLSKKAAAETATSDKHSAFYENGDKVTGTVIFLNPYSKIVYLSLLPHLVDSRKLSKVARLFTDDEANSQKALKVGDMARDAQVIKHSFKGIQVRFKTESNTKYAVGFVLKRHLFESNKTGADGEVSESEDDATKDDADDTGRLQKRLKKDGKNLSKEDLEKLFPAQSNVTARIYDYNLLEDVVLLSCRRSIIEAPFMRYDDLRVGMVVKCHVRNALVANGGVNVSLSAFVSGFIPKIHTGDKPLSDTALAIKMAPNKQLRCLVLRVDADEKRCVLSAKSTLVKSKLPLIDSFEGLVRGQETYGTVISIQPYGLLLGFLNDLKGLLPRKLIGSAQLLDDKVDLKDIYYLGQVIKCKVFEFNKQKQLLKLAIKMDDASNTDGTVVDKNKQAASFVPVNEYEIGDLIESATIVQVNELNCFFKVKLPRGAKQGILYKNHLSDIPSLNDALFAHYRQTMCVNNVMITQHAADTSVASVNVNAKKNKHCHYLTLKDSLIDFYVQSHERIARTLSDLEGMQVAHGWIRKVLPSGLLVEIPRGFVGFCSNKQLKHAQELRETGALTIGQSVLLRINRIVNEKQQFLASVRTRYDLLPSNSDDVTFMIDLCKSYLSGIKRLFSEQTEDCGALTSVRIGSVVTVVVRKYHVATGHLDCVFMSELSARGDDAAKCVLSGNAFVGNADGAVNTEDLLTYAPGRKLEALVLAYDAVARVFCLTVDKRHVKVYARNFEDTFATQIKCKRDQEIKGEVVYAATWFCIVGLRAHALGRLAFLPLFRNDFTQLNTSRVCEQESLRAGESTEARVKQQQLMAVSVAATISAESNDEDTKQKVNREDKRFAYYCVGQLGKVCVKVDEVPDMDYLIVTQDRALIKRNRRATLRQLAVLNENPCGDLAGDVALKRKANESDEPVLVRKRLQLNDSKRGDKKRPLSELNATPSNSDKDFIEIVADVKSSTAKRMKLDETNGNAVAAFPWEVTSFDQFDNIVNKVGNGHESESEEDANGKKSNESRLKRKEAKILLDRSKSIVDKSKPISTDCSNDPESVEEFERLLTVTPNNAALWIKFMTYYLQIAEVEKARSVAQQALRTIGYQEDAERLSVWVALLGLENLHGTQASIEDTFNRATQNCDSLKVHAHLADIYAQSGKLEEAESIYIKMTRKFSQQQDVWVKYAIFHYVNSNCELARKLLIKSLNSLDKKDHVEMVNKFAQLEFKYGDSERAKTMFDSLLFTYPNRTDIWSVYIDMLVKHKLIDDARHIFGRIIQLGLTAKRMKFIFKKYMDFEKVHGSEDAVDKVMEMAQKYVESGSMTKKSDASSNGHSIEFNLKKDLKI